ncbi:MAG: 50S ribosome-binding GTPase [Phycisphaera sp.]|nr:MAG: 50S ribosome-binding GTPase [Phycisphaera sp.]
MTFSASFAQRSTPGIASAVAVFEVVGDIESASKAIGFTAPTTGRAALRTVPNVDTLLAIRPSETVLLLTPHGGVQVCRALSKAMLDAGLSRTDEDPAWPEASSDIEARMLTALATVRGERAVAHLLAQPARWASKLDEVPADVARELSRLLHPPLVVATGPANVGKSSLANALAGRTVARVADRPGVTRDAVAVDLELDGLVVRWLDAPGVDLAGDDVLAEAQALAEHAIAAADLVIWCQDASEKTPSDREDAATSPAGSGGGNRITVATRADLHPGPPPTWADAAVSTVACRGLPDLARLVRQRLVSDEALTHPGAWGFWTPTP